jgi:Arc/MetJ family transcription regulator
MARTRLSTTVDQQLLADARRAHGASTDADLVDEALRALVARHRATEIDAAYARAYSEHPLDTPDEWGDLASFRNTIAR